MSAPYCNEQIPLNAVIMAQPAAIMQPSSVKTHQVWSYLNTILMFFFPPR